MFLKISLIQQRQTLIIVLLHSYTYIYVCVFIGYKSRRKSCRLKDSEALEVFKVFTRAFIPVGSLVLLFRTQNTINDANNKRYEAQGTRFAEAAAANNKRYEDAAATQDKRFADIIASQKAVRAADENKLTVIVEKLSNEIKASDD